MRSTSGPDGWPADDLQPAARLDPGPATTKQTTKEDTVPNRLHRAVDTARYWTASVIYRIAAAIDTGASDEPDRQVFDNVIDNLNSATGIAVIRRTLMLWASSMEKREAQGDPEITEPGGSHYYWRANYEELAEQITARAVDLGLETP
ncbi:MAG: hypothetical protein JWO98_4865 [Frankiales bacterium]|nr:hypothetical protein [Frankiales bacterium]